MQEVTYVDVARNMAVVLGERDVKTDVKAKNKLVSFPTSTRSLNYCVVGEKDEELQL